MRTPLGDKIHALLRKHRGEDHSITAAEIAHALRTNDRAVRSIIASESSLWSDLIVCGFGGLGYFACADIAEAIKYRDWLLGTFTEIGEKIEMFEAHCRRHGLRVPPPMDELLGAKVEKLRAWLDRWPGRKTRRAA